MATYFHSNPEIQAEGLQTLVLMNPSYIQYAPDTSASQQPPSNNLVFLNSAASHLSQPQHLPPSTTQQFVGIPLDPNSHDASTLHGLIPRVHYNLYNPIDLSATARDTPRPQQGLSLSLSSQRQHGFGSVSGEDMRGSGGSVSPGSGLTNGVCGIQGVLLSSKYLRAAQELLDEVVSVNGDGIKSEISKNKGRVSDRGKGAGDSSSGRDGLGSGDGSGGKVGPELSTAERQEVQMKKAKLMNILDEVEQRYRQYHHQMQIVISSFEQAAGMGSAKTYTALALKTISKQFRCLKDAIAGQIKAANKSLGEEVCLGGKIEGSRLKFVDHHLRQQRTLQQLGMIQHNAWRPQRGLPERSVSILRAWLFEHFLHPYPKDSDKHMLAKQTGLTRSQVSNWFINARVRLWKPMVEEMYMEEVKDQERNGSEDKTSKNERNEVSGSKSFPQEKNSGNDPISTTSTSNIQNQGGFSLIGSSELDGITQGSPKKPRSNEMLQSITSLPSINMDIKPGEPNNEVMATKFGNERQSRDGYSFMGGQSQTNFIGGFGQYPMAEIGRFDGTEPFTPRFSGNGVSLTLGLPHCDNLSLSAAHQSFIPGQNIQLGRRVELGNPSEFGAIDSSAAHSSTAFESINIQSRKGGFNQMSLLPDFVA